jgi:DNA replication protein DnaC
MKSITSESQNLELLLKSLRLPSFVAGYEEIAEIATKGGWSFARYLRHLAEVELADREQRRFRRLLKISNLPSEKTLERLDLDFFPAKVQKQLSNLCEGDFVERAENILAFGLPGRGKTHLLCAIGHKLIHRGYRVLFVPTFKLVQRLLAAKRDLAIEAVLRKLERFDVIILDDIGYVQQGRDEMEVLFMFLGERYEKRSVMITSNLVFSQWDRIFKDKMTTAAAIDRVVHHSNILELTSEKSYRATVAEKRNGGRAKKRTKKKAKKNETKKQR